MATKTETKTATVTATTRRLPTALQAAPTVPLESEAAIGVDEPTHRVIGHEAFGHAIYPTALAAPPPPHPAGSSIVEVPVVQDVMFRQRIVEVPEVHVVEKYQPVVQTQEIIRERICREDVVVEKVVEVPVVETRCRQIEVPVVQRVVREVPRLEVQETYRDVPRLEVHMVDKLVEVPQRQVVQRQVEVPIIQEVTVEVPRHEVVEVPIETIRHVPRVEVQTLEEIVHVPGPVETVDVQIDAPVECPIVHTVEEIHEVPVPQDVVVERNVSVPVPGPTVDVPYEVTTEVERPVTQEVPGRMIQREVPYVVERLIEKHVPHYEEFTRVVQREVQVPVEFIREVEVPEYIDEYVDVPNYVQVAAPPTIIYPRVFQRFNELPPIVEQAGVRYVHEPPQHLPPIFAPALVSQHPMVYQSPSMAAPGTMPFQYSQSFNWNMYPS